MSLEGGNWVLKNIAPHVSMKLKSVFARIPKTQTGTFILPATDQMSADLEWFMIRYPFDISSADQRTLKQRRSRFDKERADTEAILLPDWQPNELHGFRPGCAPRFGQKQAIALAHRKKGLLVGDDVGLGKTWVALGALVGSPYLPAAIVVQSHLATQWVNEYIRPYTYMAPHIIQGTQPYDLPAANLYVFKYTNIAGWVDIAETGFFRAVVFDEIQEGRRGSQAAKGSAMQVFADNAQLRLGLSATPVFNYGSEIWNIMRCIDPEVLGDWQDFVIEWCRMGPGGKWLVKEPKALGSYLREQQVFIRRLRQGRTINRIPVEVGYDESEAEKTEDLARALAIKVMEGDFGESGEAARKLDALARRVTGMAKAKSVAAYARILLEAGVPIILAGWHRDVYKIWIEELKDFNPILYTGSEDAKQKDRAKNDFIEGRTNCLIISLRSGAGLDGLQKRCCTVLVGELDWSPQIYEQLFGRVDRPGQPSDEITAIFLYSNSGSDPVVMSVNAIKKEQARGITDPDATVEEISFDVSQIKMLAQHYLDRTGREAVE